MPYYRFDIESPLPLPAVVQRLRAITREDPPIRIRKDGPVWQDRRGEATFVGEIRDTGFRMRRDLRSRNTFLPMIRGTLAAVPGGTQIGVRMRLRVFAMLFVVLWVGFFAYACVVVGADSRIQPPQAWIPPAMLVVALVLPPAFFFAGARQARRLIERALDDAEPRQRP